MHKLIANSLYRHYYSQGPLSTYKLHDVMNDPKNCFVFKI